MKTLPHAWRMTGVLLVCTSTVLLGAPPQASPADYAFTVITNMLTVTNGVRLAVTYYQPTPKTAGEKFPAVFEMHPYRKDDFFYLGDYEYGAYFAKRGYVHARIDVRGTGGSDGTLPDREYSDEELGDAVVVIDLLSKMPWCNGNVGMYGISWSGFNSLMVAQRKPPALKAIITAHASQDLYYNDVHYIDGVLHMDYYAQQIDTDNALPQSPDYKLDDAWRQQRFAREPWIVNWFRQQRDGEFWRRESLLYKPPLEVPAYLVGGLLDGYRDFVPYVIEHSTAPVIAEIGPWNHAWPEYGKPGPNYEWRQRAIRWWDYWLKGYTNGILDEPRVMLFVRDYHTPSTRLDKVPGYWRCEPAWPIAGTTWQTLFPDAAHSMGATAPFAASHSLTYRADVGMAAGGWWGEQTPDMALDDAQCLVYDSAPLTGTVEIIGMPRVSLRVAADAPLYQWSVRLEDVHPDGQVTLVSGALINPSQRFSRANPQPLVPGEATILTASIHFTTWRFPPGHRIRLAISNAQFPMAWPTPHRGATTLLLGTQTWLALPLVPANTNPPPILPAPEPYDQAPDGKELHAVGPKVRIARKQRNGSASYSTWSRSAWRIGRKRFVSNEYYTWSVNPLLPARAVFNGERTDMFNIPGNRLRLSSQLCIQADPTHFNLTFTKTMFRNNRLVDRQTWTDSILRDFQ